VDLLKNLQSLHLSDDKSTEQHAATPSLPQRPLLVIPTHKHDDLLNKIGDVLGGEHKPTPAPVVAALPPSKKEDSLFDKLGDALGGSKHTATPPAPVVAVSEQRTTDKLFSKLGETLTGKQTPPPPPALKENHLNIIGDKLSGRKTPPPPRGNISLINS